MVGLQSNPAAWNARRRELCMSYRALAKRAGISEPTVKRVLNGHANTAAFATVLAILRALGLGVSVAPIQSTTQMRRDAARRKALDLARLVQGTSGLESQAIDRKGVAELVRNAETTLLRGSPRRLWE